MFVTFEGLEGAGKSTLIDGLSVGLAQAGVDVVCTREPGGTPLGDALRAVFLDPHMQIDPMAEALVVNASRAQLVAEVIRPALRAGRTVLCDRFFDATIAYQGFGRGLDLESLVELCLTATGRLSPDLTILIDVPVDVSLLRAHARAQALGEDVDRVEREPTPFHEAVRDGYLRLAERFPRIVVLDGTRSPAELLADAMERIAHHRALLPVRHHV